MDKVYDRVWPQLFERLLQDERLGTEQALSVLQDNHFRAFAVGSPSRPGVRVPSHLADALADIVVTFAVNDLVEAEVGFSAKERLIRIPAVVVSPEGIPQSGSPSLSKRFRGSYALLLALAGSLVAYLVLSPGHTVRVAHVFAWIITSGVIVRELEPRRRTVLFRGVYYLIAVTDPPLRLVAFPRSFFSWPWCARVPLVRARYGRGRPYVKVLCAPFAALRPLSSRNCVFFNPLPLAAIARGLRLSFTLSSLSARPGPL